MDCDHSFSFITSLPCKDTICLIVFYPYLLQYRINIYKISILKAVQLLHIVKHKRYTDLTVTGNILASERIINFYHTLSPTLKAIKQAVTSPISS